MDRVNARRGQIAVATGLSVLLHAALLAGLTDMLLPSAKMASRGAPMQARVIPVTPVVPEPESVSTPEPLRAEPAPQRPLAPRPATERPAPAAAAKPAAPAPAPAPAPVPAPASIASPPTLPSAPTVPTYRLAAELDPPPAPLGDIAPVYPVAAGLQEGTVVLRLLIGADGTVDEVIVVRADPPGLFEASAIEAFGKARFSPGRFLGVPVRSQMTIAVDYTPTNRGGAVSGQGGTPR